MRSPTSRVNPSRAHALSYECLEKRELLAGDLHHAMSYSSNSHHAAQVASFNSSSHIDGAELKAEAYSATGAKFKFEIENGRLGVSIKNASPSTSYPVLFRGNTITTLVTDWRGKASLKVPSPASVANATAGNVVSVPGIGSAPLVLHNESHSGDGHSGGQVGYTELRAEAYSATGAKFKFEIENGRLEVSIKNASPSTSYPVLFRGNTITTLVTDWRGKASLKVPSPASVANAAAGNVVSVPGIGSAALVLQDHSHSHGHSHSHDRSSSHDKSRKQSHSSSHKSSSSHHQSDNHLKSREHGKKSRKHGKSHSHDSTMSSKWTASLTGIGAGKAEFETKGAKRKFEVEVWGLGANSRYDVTVNGVMVGTLFTDYWGRGKLKIRNDKGQQLPANFPTINANSVVRIGSAVSGSFAQRNW